jgi:diaminopimelate epimerase
MQRAAGVEFYKVSGSGNDFIALVEPAAEPTPAAIRAWCRRGVSLGADGLFTLRRDGAAVAMDYWNADGGAAGLCLNGTRCAARLAFDLGWVGGEGGGPPATVTVRTGAGALLCRRLDEARIAVEVPPPAGAPAALTLDLDGRPHPGWRVEVGVPHFVLLWPESLAAAPVETLGRRLRHHPALGRDGANVDFVRFPDRRRLEIRTAERGVEAETLACGTGVLAAAAVGLALGRADLPLAARTRGGFPMGVEGETVPAPGGAGAAVRRWSLGGDARIVAAGRLLPAAGEEPAAPVWT